VKDDRHALGAPRFTWDYPAQVKRELATRLCKLAAAAATEWFREHLLNPGVNHS